jgi:hypothetical protein
MVKGAAAFGVHLSADGEDLAYHADCEVSRAILEKIAARTDELVAELKTRRAQVPALWPKLQDLDCEQYRAFRDV